MTSPADLEAVWAELEAQGATVHRVPMGRLGLSGIAALVWAEKRRLRAIAERDLPAPAPYDWRAHRVAMAAAGAVATWRAA